MGKYFAASRPWVGHIEAFIDSAFVRINRSYDSASHSLIFEMIPDLIVGGMLAIG
jgi:hypothetical protein